MIILCVAKGQYNLQRIIYAAKTNRRSHKENIVKEFLFLNDILSHAFIFPTVSVPSHIPLIFIICTLNYMHRHKMVSRGLYLKVHFSNTVCFTCIQKQAQVTLVYLFVFIGNILEKRLSKLDYYQVYWSEFCVCCVIVQRQEHRQPDAGGSLRGFWH